MISYHTIRKVKFLSKYPTFSRVFHQIFFWQFFSWNQSCQQLKGPKSQHFHEFFTPKKISNFLVQSWFCGQKWRFRTVCYNCFDTYQFMHLYSRRLIAEQRRAKSHLECYDHEKVKNKRGSSWIQCINFCFSFQSLSSDSDSSNGSSSR